MRTIDRADELLQQIEQCRTLATLQGLYDEVEPLLEELCPVLLGELSLAEIRAQLLVHLYLSDHLNPPTELDINLHLLRYIATRHPETWLAVLEGEQNLFDRLRRLYRVGRAVRQYAIYRELMQRFEENEDDSGGVVRRFLVHRRDVDGKLAKEPLEKLQELVLWKTPDAVDLDEKRSIARLEISAELKEYSTVPAVGLDPKGLEDMVEGHFNRTGWKIRDRVRSEIGKELRFQKRRANVEVTKVADRERKHRPGEPSDKIFKSTEARILIEKLKEYLSPRQREFLEIRLESDTDAEAAQKLGVTPAAVSQLNATVMKIAREHLSL